MTAGIDPLVVADDSSCAGIRTITLAHPSSANSLSRSMVEALHAAIDAAIVDSVPALIFRAAGASFSSGFDLAELDVQTDESLTERFVELQTMLDRLTSAPFVSLAVIDGSAVGAGADLAIACDVRVATARSRFRFPGSRFGIVLGLPRLHAVVGAGRAVEIVGGRWVDAETAGRWGLITHPVESSVEADQLARALMNGLLKVERNALNLMVEELHASAHPGLPLLRRSLTPGLHGRLNAFTTAMGRERSGHR